jgi:hypothetical protein
VKGVKPSVKVPIVVVVSHFVSTKERRQFLRLPSPILLSLSLALSITTVGSWQQAAENYPKAMNGNIKECVYILKYTFFHTI